MLKKIFDGGVIQFGRGDEMKKSKVEEFVAGDFAGFDHRWLAEEISLETGEAEIAGFGEFFLGFHFLGKQSDAGLAIFFDYAAAAFGVEKLKIDFEIVGAFNERSETRPVNEVVECERVAGAAEVPADPDDFLSGRNGFENFDDDLAGRKQARRVEAKGEFVYIDEGQSVASKCLQVKKSDGIRDDAGGRVFVGGEVVLRATAEKKFVGKNAKAFIEDGLAGNELLVH